MMRLLFLLPCSTCALGALIISPTITPTVPVIQRRDDDTYSCNTDATDGFPLLCLTSYPPFTDSPSTATVTSPPKPSCSLQDEDPSRGIESEYCVCEGVLTLPLLTPASNATVTESCDYSTLPMSTSQLSPTTDLAPATTNVAACQVCTPYGVNGDNCMSMASCLVQTASATVQAGNSPVHVGTLTSTALSASISSALNQICPTVATEGTATSCSTEQVTIGDISFSDNGVLSKDGELVVSVDSSSYNLSSLRKAMIDTAALTAMNVASGNNCYTAGYEMGEERKRSWVPPSSFQVPRFSPELADRATSGEVETPGHETWCNTGHFAGIQYYPQFWRQGPSPGPAAFLDAEWSFHVAPDGAFDCELLIDIVEAGLAVVAPEFTVGDVELGSVIAAGCDIAFDKGSPS